MGSRTRRYIIRRIVVVILTLFVVTLLSFLLMRLSPIDPATAYVKRNSAIVTQEQIEEARVMLGLNKSLPAQYLDWVYAAVHMDFGISLGTGNRSSYFYSCGILGCNYGDRGDDCWCLGIPVEK